MKKTYRLNIYGSFSNRYRLLSIVLTIVMLLAFSSVSVTAANVSVKVNGDSLYSSRDLLKSGVTYVPLRAFSNAVYEGFDITWIATTKTAVVRVGDYILKARVGDRFVTVNDKRIESSAPNLLIVNRIHVPVRSVCTAMGLDVSWNSRRSLVSVSGNYSVNDNVRPPNENFPENGVNIDSKDLYWMSRIIHAESAGEPMAGKIAVGTVVMNRVNSSLYPDNVYDVIFDRKFGTQFTPVASGTIYNEPSAESIEAARRVLSGERTDNRILFFVNEKIATSNWISQNRTYIMTIGNHKFYA